MNFCNDSQRLECMLCTVLKRNTCSITSFVSLRVSSKILQASNIPNPIMFISEVRYY